MNNKYDVSQWYDIIGTYGETWEVFIPPSETFVPEMFVVAVWRKCNLIAEVMSKNPLLVR